MKLIGIIAAAIAFAAGCADNHEEDVSITHVERCQRTALCW